MQDGVRITICVGRYPQPCARGKFADHRLGHHRLSAIGLGARGKERHRERAYAGRQVSGRAQRVVPAAGERQQCKSKRKKSNRTHDSS
jgi:hypothetical protein